MSNDSNETIIALYYKLGEIARQVEDMRDSIARLYLGDVYATRPNEVGTTVEVPSSWPDFPGDLWGFERARYEAWLKSVEGHIVASKVADMLNDIFGDDSGGGGRVKMVDPRHYTYRVIWSDDDQEYVGLCAEFPSLSHLDSEQSAALQGIVDLVAYVTEDMADNGDKP